MGYQNLKKNHATNAELKAYREMTVKYYNHEIAIAVNQMHKATCMNKLKRSQLYADALAQDNLILDLDGIMTPKKPELTKKEDAKRMAGTKFLPAPTTPAPKPPERKHSLFSFRKK